MRFKSEDTRLLAKKQKQDVQYLLQAGGYNRYDARRQVYGETQTQARSYPTRRSLLIEQAAQHRARRRLRKRRTQQVAAASLVGYLVEA